ncbi:hypothetical protein [Nonomuraea ceibae]|uniref:hypothetical protein n=1 Tax=Nonomuraea ceibae TaxID=1935170 RepID=UPI001C5E66B6|nr:hypothetical protein [Nonomuraea ceibae]
MEDPFNYLEIASYGEGVGTYATNSMLVSALTVGGTLVMSALGGYAFARFDARVRTPCSWPRWRASWCRTRSSSSRCMCCSATSGCNSLVELSPVFVMFQLPFTLFMMRNALEAIPGELQEAGVLPHPAARRTALVTAGLFALPASWNDSFAPLSPLNDGLTSTLH